MEEVLDDGQQVMIRSSMRVEFAIIGYEPLLAETLGF